MVTQEYHVQGPVMILLTTTAIDIDEELLNRCIVLTVDESREQTRAIHALQRERETLTSRLPCRLFAMLPLTMAAKEKIGSWLAAWLCPLLLLLAAVAAAPSASALTPGALETRAWKKSAAALQSCQAQLLQPVGLHQENDRAGYNFAP